LSRPIIDRLHSESHRETESLPHQLRQRLLQQNRHLADKLDVRYHGRY
jgi:hypothetical protein